MSYTLRTIRFLPKVFVFALILIQLTVWAGTSRSAEKSEGKILDGFTWITANWDDDALYLELAGIKPGEYTISELSNPPRIIIDIPSRPSGGNKPYLATYNFAGGLLSELRASTSPEGTRVVLESKYALPWEVAKDEPRKTLELKILLRFRQSVEEMAIDKGTTYYARRYVTPSGQRFVHAVISDPKKSDLRPGVFFAEDVTRKSVAKVSEIASGANASVAINGGYFAYPGNSLSLVVQDGVVKAPPQFHRPAFMVMDDGTCRIDYPLVHATVSDSHGIKFLAETINQRPDHGHISLLTPFHPSRLHDDMPGTKAVFSGNILEYITDGEIDDFSERVILWSRKDYPPLSLLRVGEPVEITYDVAPSVPGIKNAMQGGPFLVHKGKITLTTDADDIGRDIAVGRSARTAIGIDDDGRTYFVVVESPASDRSIGSTLQELALTMQDLGATYAMNLDGGSSSSMALAFNKPQTSLPSGNRAVATSMVLFDASDKAGKKPIYF
jgi:exopolysaccharide biosynthesis protein